MSLNQSQRHFSRIPFDAETHVLSVDNSQKWPCTLIDIGLDGALTSLPADWPGQPGESYRIELQLGSGHEEELCLHMDVKVIHMEHDHVGFEIAEMDVDTASHLHRLIELNEGDTNSLKRELAELIERHKTSVGN